MASSQTKLFLLALTASLATALPAQTPSRYAFGSQTVGNSSIPQSVSFTFPNGLAAPVATVSVLTSGTPNLDFTAAAAQPSDACAAGSLTAAGDGGTECTLAVVFSPTRAGVRSGAAVLLDANGNALATAYLGGVGVGPNLTFPDVGLNNIGMYNDPSEGPWTLVGSGVKVSPGAAATTFGIAADEQGDVYLATTDTAQNQYVVEFLAGGGSRQVGSGLINPTGVCLDGAGNLYVGGSQALYQISPTGQQTTLMPLEDYGFEQGLGGPYQVHACTVDNQGHLYVGNGGVMIVDLATLATSSLPLPGITQPPAGLAVDAAGNVYVADTFDGQLLAVAPNGAITTYQPSAGGLAFITSVAIDAGGNLWAGGIFNSVFFFPAGSTTGTNLCRCGSVEALALDLRGNLYLSSGALNNVTELHLADVPDMGLSASATLTLDNAGNAPLNLANVALAAQFPYANNGGTCATGTVLATNQTCTLAFTAAPPSAAVFNGVGAVLTDNSANNGVEQVIGLTTGTVPTLQLTPLPAAAVASPTPQSLVAAISGSFNTPTGSFTYVTDNGTPQSVPVGPKGYATLPLGTLSGGTHQVQVTYSGDAVYGSITNAITLTVNAVPSPVATVTLVPQPSGPIDFPAPLSIAVTVSGSQSVPTGSLLYSIDGASAQNGGSLAGGAAAITLLQLAPGTHVIAVNYSGDGTYPAAMASLQNVVVNAPPSVQFAPANVGTTSGPATVNFFFAQTTVVAAVPLVLTQGASGLDFAAAPAQPANACAAQTYAAGSSCAYNVTFTPARAANRGGAVVLADANGNALATAYLAGTGLGAQIAFANPNSPTIMTLATQPNANGVAVDASGNVFVASQAPTPSVIEYLAGGGTRTIGQGFATPSGVCVDGAGNVYVADSTALYEVTPSGTQTQFPITLAGGAPLCAIANNNLYVANLPNYSNSNGLIAVISLQTGAVSLLASDTNLGQPVGMAADANGNVFISSGNFLGGNRLLEIPAGGGDSIIIDEFSNSGAVAVDAAGNVFTGVLGGLVEYPAGGGNRMGWRADSGYMALAFTPSGNLIGTLADGRIRLLDLTDAPAISDFGTVDTGTTSGAQTLTLTNAGNAALQFSGITASTGFTTTGSCATGINLAPTASCTVGVAFQPATGGAQTGTLTLADNAANQPAPQVYALSGTGNVVKTDPSISLIASPAATVTYPATITIQVGISGAAAQAGGTVTYTVDGGAAQGPVAVTSGAASLPLGTLNPGNHSVTVNYSGDDNYNAGSQTYSGLVVDAIAPPNVAMAAPSATYGAPVSLTITLTNANTGPIPTGSVTVAINGGVAQGPFSLSAGTAAIGLGVLNAGTYSVAVNYNGDANNPATHATGGFTVAAATLNVMGPVVSAVAGAPIPALNPTYSGFVNGDSVAILTAPAVCTSAATPGGASGAYPVNCLGAAAVNYTANPIPGTLTITTGTAQKIAFATLGNTTYGVGLIALNATSSAGLPVAYAVLQGNASVVATATGSALAVTGIGTVVVEASQTGNGTYAPAQPVDRAFNVAPRALNLTANNASRAVGQANPAFTYTVTGLVNGDTAAVLSTVPVLATTAVEASPTGTYPIAFTNTAITAANYELDFTGALLTVTPGHGGAAQKIAFSDIGNRTYGAAAITLSAKATSALPVSFSVISGPAVVNGNSLTVTAAGTVVVEADQAGDGVTWQAADPVQRTFVVSPKLLTVTATSVKRTYVEANPVFTYTFKGLVNGDSANVVSGAPALNTVATGASDPGTYTITIAAGNLFAANYSFDLEPGTLTITQASQTVSFPSFGTVYYGTTVLPNGVASTGLPLTYQIDAGGGIASINPSFFYAVTLTGTGTVTVEADQAGNVDFLPASAKRTFTVKPAILTISADNQFISPGQPIPTLTYSVNGFVNNDDPSILMGTPILSTSAKSNSPNGNYPIRITKGTLVAPPNYTLTFVLGTLTIGRPISF